MPLRYLAVGTLRQSLVESPEFGPLLLRDRNVARIEYLEPVTDGQVPGNRQTCGYLWLLNRCHQPFNFHKSHPDEVPIQLAIPDFALQDTGNFEAHHSGRNQPSALGSPSRPHRFDARRSRFVTHQGDDKAGVNTNGIRH